MFNNKLRSLGLVALSAIVTSKALAVGEIADGVTAVQAIPAALGVAAGAVAAISAGVLLFRMIKRYLGKAS